MAHAASAADLRVSALFSYSTHVALVTGGATGLGEIAAQALVQNGARVLIASRKEPELARTTARLNALGPGTCEYIVADLSSKAGCLALCDEVKRRTDRLTVLLNNSGATWGDDYHDFPEAGWDKLMSLNVKSAFYTTVGLDALLRNTATATHPSRVVNIASMAGVSTRDVTTGDEGGLSKPGTGTFSYGPSKAALIHLTKLTASKLAPAHITVNAVCPGVFPSRMTAYGLDAHADALVRAQPTGRVGTPEDFAGVVLWLVGRGGAHVTGVALEVDGGATVSGWRSKM